MARRGRLAAAAALATVLNFAPGARGATVQLFAVPSADSGLQHIAVGSDGALWFTERKAGKVGRITTSGQIAEYPIPNDASGLEDTGPDAIVAGPDAMWFLTDIGESVDRITTAGYTRVFRDQLYPASTLAPSDNGGVWLMPSHGVEDDQFDDAIRRVNPDGSSQDYRATHLNNLNAAALAPDGALWFNNAGGAT